MKNAIFSAVCILFLGGCSIQKNIGENLGHITYLDFDIAQEASILPPLDTQTQNDGKELLEKRLDMLSIKAPNVAAKDAFWALNYYQNTSKRQYYFSNMRKIPNEWFEAVRKNADISSFGMVSLPAITTANTSVRNLPTDEAVLFNPVRAGEGLPFDYLQLSFISIAHPLYISHFSADGAWAFVGSDSFWGWVKATDIKILSQNEVDTLKNSKFLSITKENEPVYDKNGRFLFFGRVGAILPFEREDELKFYGEIWTQNGLKNYEILKLHAGRFPLKFNDANIKKLSASLLGQSYGWGGYGGKRDCSLFLQDFLGGFGVWLPRNSKAQGGVGKVIDLSNLSNNEKKAVIKANVKPYRTLFHLNGHIMLFVGFEGEKILAMHDVWGLHTKDNGRAMIGGVAITTLEIGSDNEQIEPNKLLLSKINSMNILEVSSDKNEPKKQAIMRAYGVKFEGENVVFADGSKIKFDDGTQKDKQNLLENADIEDIFSEPYPPFKSLAVPTNDAGRYRNYELLDKIYGSSENEVRANLTDVVWLKDHGAKVFKFNAKNGAAAALQAVSDELDVLATKKPEMLKFIDAPSGTFNWRTIADTNRKSAHSYGIAIDINTDKSDYWRWSKDGKYRNLIPREIVEVFEKHGFIWGGRWVSFDTMHFEYRPEFIFLK